MQQHSTFSGYRTTQGVVTDEHGGMVKWLEREGLKNTEINLLHWHLIHNESYMKTPGMEKEALWYAWIMAQPQKELK
jgi:hypothetical protein